MYQFIVARSKGLPDWNYVLYPKAGGLSSLLNAFRPLKPLNRIPTSSTSSVGDIYGQNINAFNTNSHSDNNTNNDNNNNNNKQNISNNDRVIQDVTIAYKDFITGERPVESSILKGEFPPEIHLLVRRFPVSNLPNDEISLQYVSTNFLVYLYSIYILIDFYILYIHILNVVAEGYVCI